MELLTNFDVNLTSFLGSGVTCICCDTGICYYFGYFSELLPGFLGTFLAYSQIGIDFDILLITLWNVACRALVSYFLQSDL